MAIVILLLLFSGLFLGLVLVTLAGDLTRAVMEDRPVAQPAQRKPAMKVVEEIPSFFAVQGSATARVAGPWSNEELIRRLEGHLRSEQALVASFLLEPSVDSLYRRSPASLQVH